MATRQETERFRKSIDKFCLMDDTFMSAVFRNPKCVQKALRIILNDDEIIVREAEAQVSVSNLYGRAIRMDVKAVLEGSKVCDVEVQRAKEGSSPKRARYYSSLLDANIAKLGDKYQTLPETFVIFITEKDVLREGLPIYHIERVITETGKLFGDGAHIIYVNGESRSADTELGRLVHDLFCTRADEMYTKELADETKRLKETEGGQSQMCEVMERLFAEELAEARTTAKAEGRAEGIAEGKAKGKAEGVSEANRSTSLNLARVGFSAGQIAQIVNADVQTVEGWIAAT